ncbi:MAG: putative lipid II flippase FtsW [Bacteroidia bacterium]|nr:putative lipid II flippase FtsW [Bacteroidia bacterium]
MLGRLINWNKLKPQGDPVMWSIIAILSVWGVVAVYSSTGKLAFQNFGGIPEIYLLQQVFYLTAGFMVMLAIHKVHYYRFMRFAKLILYVAYILLVLTFFMGAEINSAQRWLKIPFIGITLQTSEIAKVALIVYVSSELARKQEEIKDFKKGFLPILIHVGITALLIAPNNLSTALVLALTSVVVMFIGRASIRHIMMVGIPTLAAIALMGFIVLQIDDAKLKPLGRLLTWKNRIIDFKNDKVDPDKSYQTDHAKMAIASGGFFGKGPGQSTERNFLPEAYSDFIFAIIIEEYGMVGGTTMLFLYLLFMYRALRIIRKSPKAFGALVAVGLSFALVTQALVNMAVAVNVFPVTGLTLPLVSKGGTSIIITAFAFGMIMSVSRYVELDEPETQPES